MRGLILNWRKWLPLPCPEAQSLLKDLTQEPSKTWAAWLYGTDLVRNKLHLKGAEIKQLVAIVQNGKVVSLLKYPTQLMWKVGMIHRGGFQPIYLVDMDFYGLEGCPSYVRPHKGLGRLSMENISWGQRSPLAEALSTTDGCCTAMQYDDLASPEETELSPESAQLFLRRAPDKYKSCLWAMAANAKTILEVIAILYLIETQERQTRSQVLLVNSINNTPSGLNQNWSQ